MSKVPLADRIKPLREAFDAHGVKEPERIVQYSLLSPNRLAGVIRACDAVKDIPGATAEIGCASGGTTRLIALLCKRPHWACDTFEGLVDAGEIDDDLSNGDFRNDESTFEGVSSRAADLPNVTVLQGRFPDCAPVEMADAFYALVHIDTDTYQSMKDCFEWFAGRIVPGGMLILDDVIGRGTTGGKAFWAEANREGWELVEKNDPHVILRKV